MSKSKKFGPFLENVSEATAACLLTMVQGNLLVLSVGHWVLASQTGIVAGLIASTALILAKTDKRWVVSLVLGLITAIVDYFVHPGMFGSVVTEAIVTGIAAAILSYTVGTVVRLVRARKR